MGFIDNVKALKVQSASTIALESMKYLLKFSSKHGFGKEFDRECLRLLKARPTAVVLYNSIDRVKKERNAAEIREVIKEIEGAKAKVAANSEKIFLKKTTVLTHCHSTFEIAALVKNRGHVRDVIVTETRPKNQGVKTAKELIAKKIPVTFIVDSAVADAISRADIVMVGADALRKEGVVNKVGTHMIAHEAKENGKPFFVLTSMFTIDRRKKFIMEQRPAEEIEKIKGAKIMNPAFDITPWKFVTAVITEKGILKPAQIKKLL